MEKTGLCSQLLFCSNCVPPLAWLAEPMLCTSSLKPPDVTSAETSRGCFLCFYAMTRHLRSSHSSLRIHLPAGT